MWQYQDCFFEKKKPTNSSAAKEKIMQYDSLKENIDQQSRKSESKNFKNPNLEKSWVNRELRKKTENAKNEL